MFDKINDQLSFLENIEEMELVVVMVNVTKHVD